MEKLRKIWKQGDFSKIYFPKKKSISQGKFEAETKGFAILYINPALLTIPEKKTSILYKFDILSFVLSKLHYYYRCFNF